MNRPEGLWLFTEMVLDHIERLGGHVLIIEAHAPEDDEGSDFLWGELTPHLSLSDGEYMKIDQEADEYTAAFGMRGCCGGDPTWGDGDHRFLLPTAKNAELVARSYCSYFTRRSHRKRQA